VSVALSSFCREAVEDLAGAGDPRRIASCCVCGRVFCLCSSLHVGGPTVRGGAAIIPARAVWPCGSGVDLSVCSTPGSFDSTWLVPAVWLVAGYGSSLDVGDMWGLIVSSRIHSSRVFSLLVQLRGERRVAQSPLRVCRYCDGWVPGPGSSGYAGVLPGCLSLYSACLLSRRLPTICDAGGNRCTAAFGPHVRQRTVYASCYSRACSNQVGTFGSYRCVSGS